LLLLGSGSAGWGAAMAVALFWLGLVALIIVGKYAFYPNARQFRITQALVVAVALLLIGDPVYPVLLLVAVTGLPWQSRRRLRMILGHADDR
jgi:MFS-type transporter involved in bile tolerance (Atg22 family)